MSKFQFYIDFDVRYGPTRELQEQGEQDFLLTRLFQGIHAAIVQECGDTAHQQDKLATSFPLSTGHTHGGVIRVLSPDPDILGRMIRHPKLHRYASALSVTILPVPPAHRFCTFSRNRKNDKISPSAQRRADARLKNNGHAINPIQRIGEGFVIQLRSESNGNTVPLRICKTNQPESIDGFNNSYGLSRKASIPMF